jgi:hypothetical protein
MNRKVLLGLIVVLTLTTAVVHLLLGGGMLTRGGPGGFAGGRPPADFQPPKDGQFSGNGQPPGGFQPPEDGQFPGGGQPPNRGQFQGGPGWGLFMLMGLLPILFVLNAAGYLILLVLAAVPLPYFRDRPALSHWLLIGYTALTFVLYFVMNGLGSFLGNPMAIMAKAAELLLIVVTSLHLRAVRNATVSTPASGATTTVWAMSSS